MEEKSLEAALLLSARIREFARNARATEADDVTIVTKAQSELILHAPNPNLKGAGKTDQVSVAIVQTRSGYS